MVVIARGVSFVPSSLLFHGPAAESGVKAIAEGIGRIIGEFGRDGLKVDDAREVVGLLRNPPLGAGVGCILVGPLDKAAQKSQDVLLKSVEDGTTDSVMLLLWAKDVGSVMDTIRSRCLVHWINGDVERDPDVVRDGRMVLDNLIEGRTAEMIVLIHEHKEHLADLLELIVEAASQERDRYSVLWSRVRKAAKYSPPTELWVINALLGG